MPDITVIRKTGTAYPARLLDLQGYAPPDAIYAAGDAGLLNAPAMALFCSVRCPGDLILRTFDLARDLRTRGQAVVSGFHSPMEKECLSILLRGKQPVIYCLARRLTGARIPVEYRVPMAEGRLLLLSPFGEKVKRTTSETARGRNNFVAALADRVFMAHAAPGSRTEAFCGTVLSWRRQVLTFDDPHNANLIALGANIYRE